MTEIRSKIGKSGTVLWRFRLRRGLVGLALSVSMASNEMLLFIAPSVLTGLVSLVQLSLWSAIRRSWL